MTKELDDSPLQNFLGETLTLQSAWTSTNLPLAVVGKGENLLPTIHVQDLASIAVEVGGYWAFYERKY